MRPSATRGAETQGTPKRGGGWRRAGFRNSAEPGAAGEARAAIPGRPRHPALRLRFLGESPRAEVAARRLGTVETACSQGNRPRGGRCASGREGGADGEPCTGAFGHLRGMLPAEPARSRLSPGAGAPRVRPRAESPHGPGRRPDQRVLSGGWWLRHGCRGPWSLSLWLLAAPGGAGGGPQSRGRFSVEADAARVPKEKLPPFLDPGRA